MAANKKKSKSLVRRIAYFLAMLITGGGAGMGGWAFKDHPILHAVYTKFVGQAPPEGSPVVDLKDKLEQVVASAINSNDPRKAGVFKVKVAEIKLDSKLFKFGRTVDIQTRVLKVDPQKVETVVWESKQYGENLAVVGKDDLSVSFTNRPFEIDWNPDDSLMVEVWDRKGSFLDRRELRMSLAEPGVFPLASGTHPLEVGGRGGASLNSSLNHVVFQSERVRDSEQVAAAEPRTAGTRDRNNPRGEDARPTRGTSSRRDDPRDVAARPIVIK